jgi:hypothetical protein
MALTTSVPTSRIVRGAVAELAYQGVDADGEPTDPGTVTVQVIRADGTELKAAGTATVGSGNAVRTVALTAADTAQLDVLMASWSIGGAVVAVTEHEIVGGVYLSVSEIRSVEPALSSATEYPAKAIVTARQQVEQMFESACNRAFVPRFRVDALSGSGQGTLVLRRPDVRKLRFVRLHNGVEFEDVDVEQLSVNELGAVGGYHWPNGFLNVQVGYEYGLDRPPADLRNAAVQAIRAHVNTFRSGIPDRATSFQPIDGGNVVLATPGLGPWVTGIPSVDEAIKRYRWRDAVIA